MKRAKVHFVKPKIPFTKEAFRQMEEKIESLQEKRETAVQNLQTAREMGDLSENGAYKAARWELGGIDRELRRLNYLKKFGHIEEKKVTGIVGFGNQITLKNDSSQITFTLVGSFEADPKKNKLSLDSPIGKAVLGRQVGDTITLQAPSGTISFKLVKLE